MSRVTTAAEGLARRAFTVAELEQMVAAGILEPDERIELFGGDVVPMAPKSLQHEMPKSALSHKWAKTPPAGLLHKVATTFRLSEDTYLEPDVIFYPRRGGYVGLNASTARLIIEIADMSLVYDCACKAELYARFGIAELWVIHALKLQTRVHREPTITGYRAILDLTADQPLVCSRVPSITVTLADLDPS